MVVVAVASAGTRSVTVGAVVALLLVAGGPAHGEVGDLVVPAAAAAVDGVAQDEAQDPFDDVHDSVDPIVRQVLRKVAPSRLVRKVTRPVAPSPAEDSASTDDDHSRSSLTRPARGAGNPARDRASAGRSSRRTPVTDSRSRRGQVVERRAGQVTPVTAQRAVHPCRSQSLTARELRRCARAESPHRGSGTAWKIPGLGGIHRALVPVGLLLVAIGLALVARGRRHAPLAHTTM